MSIKKKISKGFVVIGTILLVSSVVSIYEFIRMRNTVANLINDNISAITTSRQLLEVADEYNFNLLEGMGDDHWMLNLKDENDNRFSEHLAQVRDKFTTQQERMFADSVLYAYTSYIWVMNIYELDRYLVNHQFGVSDLLNIREAELIMAIDKFNQRFAN